MGASFALTALAALCAPAPATGMTGADAAGPPFVDRFERINADVWTLSDGWSNGDWMANDWRASQVRTGNGGARVLLERRRLGAKRFSSGELQTNELYRYGYFEARMQVPRGSGIVSGFFTYTQPGGQQTWDEIDIEILGRDTRQIQFTYFRGGERLAVTLPLGFDAAEGMHTYAFEWATQYIRWYVDGRLMYEATGENLALPHRPQRLYLNLWNSDHLTDWVGPIAHGRGPWTLQVACIAHARRYEGRALCTD
ncbi:MAG: family 16 glycosylhydrolase [Hyphomonadaceae bacterium]